MIFWKKKNTLINSDEYEKLNKKIVEIEAEVERLELALALYKKQHLKKVRDLIDEKPEETVQNPYGGVIGLG
jgi:hypothetical protein